MNWDTAWRLAKHPYIETFRFLEEEVFRFRLKEGLFVYDEAINIEDSLGDACFNSLTTDSEDEFNHYMANLVITEEDRVKLGVENIDLNEEEEAFWEKLMDNFRNYLKRKG